MLIDIKLEDDGESRINIETDDGKSRLDAKLKTMDRQLKRAFRTSQFTLAEWIGKDIVDLKQKHGLIETQETEETKETIHDQFV